MGRKSTFGNLTTLPSGSVRARYRGPDLGYHTRTFPLADDGQNKRQRTSDARSRASSWLDRERRLIESDVWSPPDVRVREILSSDVPSLREYAEAWLARRVAGEVGERPLKPTTARTYRSHLDNYIDPEGRTTPTRSTKPRSSVLHGIRLDHVTPALVDDWYAALPKDVRKSRADAYSTLRTIMGAAVSDRRMPVEVNPCQVPGAGKTRASDVNHEHVVLEPDEVYALADLMGDERKALVYVCAFACLRIGEAVGLTREDIDLSKRVIRVRGGIIRDDSITDGDDGVYVRSTTKSGKSRTVPILPMLVPILETHLKRHAQPGTRGLVFPGGRGGFLRRDAIWGEAPRLVDGEWTGGSGFRRARALLGHESMHWHDLRHSGATLFAQHRATVRELMELLGHSTPDVAMRYQHVASGRMSSLAESVSATVSPESEPHLRAL